MRLATAEDQMQAAEKAKNLSWKETRKLVEGMLGTAADKAAPAEKPDVPQAEPFKFARKGPGVAINAYYPGTGDLDSFLLELRTAYVVWSTKEGRDVPAITAGLLKNLESAIMAGAAPMAAHPEKADKAAPAKTDPTAITSKEMAELEALGKDGPGPICAKLAPGSRTAQLLADSTWADFGASDAKEGLPQILEILRTGVQS